MLPGPVFNVELLTTARRLRYYVIRVIFGVVLLFLIWANYSAASRLAGGKVPPQQAASFAQTVFASMMVLQVGAVLAITPSLVSGVIANERQRKTLHYLLASRLTSTEIVVGKLMARMLHVGVLLGVALPILSLMSLFGGVDPIQVLLGFGVSLSMAYLLASISIYFSTTRRRVRDALIASYAVEMAWMVLPLLPSPLLAFNAPGLSAWVEQATELLFTVTPWAAMQAIGGSSERFGAIFLMMGLQVLVGSAFVGLAVVRLRPAFRRQEDGPQGRLFGGKLGSPKPTRPTTHRPVGDNAMMWKELHTSRGSGWGRMVGRILLGLMLGGIFLWALSILPSCLWMTNEPTSSGMTGQQGFNSFLKGWTVILAMISCLLAAVGGANAITSEREEDTWISLISTPLDGEEILRAKVAGVIRRRWPIFLLLIGLWTLGVIGGAVHPLGALAEAVEVAVFVGFSAVLGLWFSLKSRSAWKSQTTTIAVLLGLNGGYLLLCCPLMMGMRGPNYWLFAGVTPFIEAVTLATPWDFGSGGNRSPGQAEHLVGTVLACVLGTAGYLAGAIFLMGSAVSRFDDAAERPRRGFARMAAKKPPASHPMA